MPHLSLNSVWLYYEVHGSGFPIILFHGGDGNSASWHKQAPVYAQHFQVIIFDERGYGRSSAPPTDYGGHTSANDILCLMEALEISRAFLVGYSMGAATAMRLALLAPSRVAAMVLSGAGSRWTISDGFRHRLVQSLTWAEQEGCGAIFDRLYTKTVFSEGFRAAHPDEVRRYRDIYAESPALGYITRLRDRLSAPPDDAAPHLAEVNIPTRFISGEHDFNRQQVEIMHRNLPGSEMFIIPGAAHAAFYEQPQRFDELVLEFFLPRLPDV